ncbi:hypothetical protein LTR96_011485 [Exophiala xenobiotica]|nr:hypothetical protein LTR41_011410 [Exophiala xenobiotica]KAK5215344.1 hypothetical protein LTR72_011597 [Exophiala xenobiotica]KAK5219853.1 hypothetical protein LTR47_011351 [Exophiala xenobiotica]KAK5242963.1 hypothetical protein LTS06_011161 [Exophiala xenobiotica]KAK5263084.1 hypothetical protein LTR96_011485 [Exophiala xenobiotica]
MDILLSNGRFPVSLDLARQLQRGGHNVYTVDPMYFHVCKFSRTVQYSWQSPAPSLDPKGYIATVKLAVCKAQIDFIIPVHEEIIYLTECLDRPEAHFCCGIEDVKKLDMTREWALKPTLGRSSTGVHHLKPGDEPAWSAIDITPKIPHVAQEWLKGNRYCTYGIWRRGEVQAFATYPVMETIDGSSSVYFEATEHEGIRHYCNTFAKRYNLTGQLAFDFVETGVEEGELKRGPHGIPKGGKYCTFWLRIKRNKATTKAGPRSAATSTPKLAVAFADNAVQLPELAARPGRARQTGLGMMMWEHKEANFKRYLTHLARLLGTKDVMFSSRDFGPVLMQPFLLASYFRICHDRGGMPLPEMFQSDVIWEPCLFGQSKEMGLKAERPLQETMPSAVVEPRAEKDTPRHS